LPIGLALTQRGRKRKPNGKETISRKREDGLQGGTLKKGDGEGRREKPFFSLKEKEDQRKARRSCPRRG